MLIAISGAISAGKSAIAQHLAERYGFRVVSFADGLREEVMARLPLTLRAMHDAEADTGGCNCARFRGMADPVAVDIFDMLYRTKPPTFRALLQEYGSDVRRADDPDYWVKRWAQKVGSIEAGRPVGQCHIVTPDCRFPNEARTVLELGGQLWKVTRPSRQKDTTVFGQQHVSETALAHWFDWDAEIANDGTLQELHAKVDAQLNPTCAQADGA